MFNLDKVRTEIKCPRCRFLNRIWLKQIRLHDVIICRGCKSNISLTDEFNSVKKAKQDREKRFKSLLKNI
jgi:hypothetical protein